MGDFVVTVNGHPTLSSDDLDLCKERAKEIKLNALRNGVPMPEVKVGQVQCDDAGKDSIEFNHQKFASAVVKDETQKRAMELPQ